MGLWDWLCCEAKVPLHRTRVLGAGTPGSSWYIPRSRGIFHSTKKSPLVFALCVPILRLGRGTLHSQGDVLPASAGFFIFLPQVSGSGTRWLQTCAEGAPSASSLPVPRDFASEAALRFHGCRGFPCPARVFLRGGGSAFGGERG